MQHDHSTDHCEVKSMAGKQKDTKKEMYSARPTFAGKGGTVNTIDDLLYLAAAPTFALMTLLSVTMDADIIVSVCSTSTSLFAPRGMPMMYLLMTLFHFPPWLRLFSRLR